MTRRKRESWLLDFMLEFLAPLLVVAAVAFLLTLLLTAGVNW